MRVKRYTIRAPYKRQSAVLSSHTLRTAEFMATVLLLLLALPLISTAKTINLVVRENITQPCPNMKSDVIDRSSVQMSFEMVSGEEGGDQATITDVNGESKTISFPACYRARLSFKMNKPIKNPYVEAFLQLGENIACQPAGSSGHAHSVCANISRTDGWCPKSNNGELRQMLKQKQTCQFCHLCNSVEMESEQANSIRKFVENEGDDCQTDRETQTLSFKMCTPSREQMNERQEEEREKLEQYWHYLKQGVLTAVVHVMDRDELTSDRRSQCSKMCSTLDDQKQVSQSYKTSLLRTIETMCSPHDTYAACVYHTVKFDINGEF